jgi:large subunit ribosomal protein L17
MRHATVGRKLGRSQAHRRALFRNLMTELFRHERIKTTEAKAKAIRHEAERLITLAQDGTGSRMVSPARAVGDRRFPVRGPAWAARPGGYTRIIKLGPRAGDAAPMVFIELVD